MYAEYTKTLCAFHIDNIDDGMITRGKGVAELAELKQLLIEGIRGEQGSVFINCQTQTVQFKGEGAKYESEKGV